MLIRKLYHFLRYNKHKRLVCKCLLYNVYYKLKIQCIPMKRLEPKLGNKGEESIYEEQSNNLHTACVMAYYVNKVSSKAPWEKKCFARALTLQKLLKEKEISSTLYMGVGKVEGQMIAHAWLRCGNYFLTGGDGTGFSKVASYRV